MRNRILSIAVAAAVLVGGGAVVASMTESASAAPVRAAATDFGPGTVPGALVAIRSDSPRGDYIDANGLPHCLPEGPNNTFRAIGDFPHMWFSGHNPNCQFGPSTTVGVTAPSPVKITHKQVTIDANFQAGTLADRTVVISGLPAFRSTSTPFEIFGSNAADVNIPATSTVPAADITVTPVGGPSGTGTVGATDRRFVVTPHLFTGERSYVLDIWVLTLVA